MSTSALETASDYITEARVLLQDRIAPYRYASDSLVSALNLALLETRRLRPDLFVYKSAGPVYLNPTTAAESVVAVDIEAPFRQAVLNGMVGYAIERDQEDIEDDRATMFIGLMRYMLTGEKPRSNANAVQVAKTTGA